MCVYEVLRNIFLSFASKVSAGWINRFHTVLPCFVTVLSTWQWKVLEGRISYEVYLIRVKLLLPTCSSYIASAALLWGKKLPSKIGRKVLPRTVLWPNDGRLYITQVLVRGFQWVWGGWRVRDNGLLFYHTWCSTWWHCVVALLHWCVLSGNFGSALKFRCGLMIEVSIRGLLQ